jgi:3-phosphoshikimate 1-carboxyvinyltransferase
MPDSLEIAVAAAPIVGRIRPPGSKSITNRALVCAALADGPSTLTGALDSDDTRVMLAALRELGIESEEREQRQTLVVQGADGRVPALEAELFCANSGTTIRFLTALATLGHGAYRLDGVARMRERPIGDLLRALTQMGATAVSENGDDCPPVVVHANGLPGGTANLRGDISSQFLSGLLMAAPCARSAIALNIEGPLVSQPYIRMTLAVMKTFGVAVVAANDLRHFQIDAPQPYVACEYSIEPDASAASYFWAAAAVTGGEVTVDGLTSDSLQGDVAFLNCLEAMGCEIRRGHDSTTLVGRQLRGIDVDMNAISDTVQTLSVVALFAEGETTIRNVAHIRHKETDRLSAAATELRKLGADVIEHEDGLTIHPAQRRSATIDTYNDHRMAMSFAIAGLKIPGVRIDDPRCVDKTYPKFFEDLESLRR